MPVDVSARKWRWLCDYLGGVASFALCNFALGRIVFGLDDWSPASDDDSFFADNGDSVIGRYKDCPIDRYCVRYVVLVYSQRMLLKSNKVRWSSSTCQQLFLCRFIRRFLNFLHHRKWWFVDKYQLVCFQYRRLTHAIVVVAFASHLCRDQPTVKLFSHEGQSWQ